ncbi:MAG: sulfatase-like hydrolase/transferase, partial [Victivallaceae bacterium]
MLRYAITFLLLFLPAIGSALNSEQPFTTALIRFGTTLGAMLVFFSIRRFPYGKGKLKNTLANIFLAAWFIFCLFDMSSFFLAGRPFDFEFYYHFNISTIRYGLGGFGFHLAGAFAWMTATVAIFVWLWQKFPARPPTRATYLTLVTGAALLFLPEGGLYAAIRMHQRVRHAAEITKLDPAKLQEFGIKVPRFPRCRLYAKPGKNLVMVYLEGFENGYLDQKNFPGLLPTIKHLLDEEALRFTNIEQPRHGNFTLAGIFASMTGSIFCDAHLLRANEHDEGGAHGYDITLGDDLATVPYLLHLAGYYQSFMLGHNPNFAGTNVFLAQERYDEALYAEKLLPPEEVDKEKWGMRDRRLFEFASKRFDELAAAGQPFALTVLTIDAHNPSGFVEPNGPVYKRKDQPELQNLNAIQATD